VGTGTCSAANHVHCGRCRTGGPRAVTVDAHLLQWLLQMNRASDVGTPSLRAAGPLRSTYREASFSPSRATPQKAPFKVGQLIPPPPPRNDIVDGPRMPRGSSLNFHCALLRKPRCGRGSSIPGCCASNKEWPDELISLGARID
jgi:hypothetical protein